jgi:hypothetical protein
MDWTATLKAIAPTVASAFLGPLGGVAVAAVGNLLGVSDATQDKIADVIKTGQLTPEQIGKLKELELQYQDTEKERGFRYAELAFKEDELITKDRDSSRTMQVATRSTTPTVLTYLVTAGFFGILGWMLYDDSVVNSPPLLIMLGTLGTAWTACVSFWVGTTNNSQHKDILLANSTPGK